MKTSKILRLLAMVVISTITINVSMAQYSNKSLESDRFENKYGTDSIECVKNLSIYGEYYKLYKRSKDISYIDASIDSWRQVFINCPSASQNLYIDGVKIVKRMIDLAENETIKQALIDTLFLVYDQRILAFDREGYVLGRKLGDMIKYRPDSVKQVYKTAERAFQLQGNKSSANALYYYMASTIDYVNMGAYDTSMIVEVYNKTSNATQYNIINNTKGVKKYSDVHNRIENLFKPYASCEVLEEVFSKKLTEQPDNIELLSKITSLLSNRNCLQTELFLKAATRLDELQPDSTSKYLIGKLNLKKKNYHQAAEYLNDAASTFSDKKSKANAYLLAAEAYSKLNQYNKARNAAQKCILYNPNEGHAYILIGNLYANSASTTKYKQLNTAYWVAVDQFYKAKKMDDDPAIQELAQKLIGQYSNYFPTKKEIFLHALNVGNTFTVGGWINQNTTIRSSD